MSGSPLQYHSTRALDAGRIEQTFDVEGHPGLRVVTTFALNDFGDLEPIGNVYHLANGQMFEDTDTALQAWQDLGDELEILDALGHAMLRHQHGLIRPLWEHRTAEQKWSWITRANSFKKLAEGLGLSITKETR